LNSKAIYFRAASELFKPIRKLDSRGTADFENHESIYLPIVGDVPEKHEPSSAINMLAS
jgi:hypothetical protein